MSRRILLSAGMLLTIFALMAWAAPQSAQAQLPPSTPTSPPPTWTPGPPAEKTPTPTAPPSEPGGMPHSVITLRVECPGTRSDCLRQLVTLRTQVEAQTTEGVWEPVVGWTGPLTEFEESSGRISWWFGDRALPYLRWIITDDDGRTRLATSEAFHPTSGIATMVTVTLPVVQPLLPASGTGSFLGPMAVICGVVAVLFTLIASRPGRRA